MFRGVSVFGLLEWGRNGSVRSSADMLTLNFHFMSRTDGS